MGGTNYIIATIAAEGNITLQGKPVSSAARKAMANVAMNRIGKREWSRYSTVAGISMYLRPKQRQSRYLL